MFVYLYHIISYHIISYYIISYIISYIIYLSWDLLYLGIFNSICWYFLEI